MDANNTTDLSASFASGTRAAFLQHLRDNPNIRRVSLDEKESLIGWLREFHRKPTSQKEASRRNYVRRTFWLDANNASLMASAKKGETKYRKVVTEDMIVDVVQTVHEALNHAGWDATWNEISSSFYGILRTDVIFLLKRCRLCAQDPRKRPKNPSNAVSDAELNDTVDKTLETYDSMGISQHAEPTSSCTLGNSDFYVPEGAT